MINTPRNPEVQNFQRQFIEYRRSVVYASASATMQMIYNQDPSVAMPSHPQTAQAAPANFVAEQRAVPQAASLGVMETVAYQEIAPVTSEAQPEAQPLVGHTTMADQARYDINQAHAVMDGGSHEYPLAA